MLDSGATLDRTAETAGAALEALQGLPQDLLDTLPIAVCICRDDGLLIRYNRRAAELWQCQSFTSPSSAGSAEPGLPERYTCVTHPLYTTDGTLLPRDATPLALALNCGTVTVDRQVIVERQDRSRVPATINAAPLRNTHGRIIGAVVCYQDRPPHAANQETLPDDRTLRESEQRHAATFEHAGIGMAEADAAGRLLRVNEAYCAISGYDRAELLGQVFHTLTHPDDRQQEINLHEQQLQGGLDRYTLEKRFIRKDGVERWVAITSSTVRSPEGAFLYSVRILRDISARKQAEERQQMLVGELNHRIKNILATVQSLAHQTIRRTSDPQHFYEKFQGRLMALSKAHSLLTRTQWQGANLRDIIEEQALPFREGKGQRILQNGDPVELLPDQAVVLGMIFHELLTNAVKHGSLSGLTGRVRVVWQVREDILPGQSWLRVTWRESDGPIIQPPNHQGFGSVFIERSVRDQLHGAIRMDYQPSGLVCLIEIPLHR